MAHVPSAVSTPSPSDVAFGRAPTPGDFDYTGPPTFTASPGLIVPSSQAGDYFIEETLRRTRQIVKPHHPWGGGFHTILSYSLKV